MRLTKDTAQELLGGRLAGGSLGATDGAELPAPSPRSLARHPPG